MNKLCIVALLSLCVLISADPKILNISLELPQFEQTKVQPQQKTLTFNTLQSHTFELDNYQVPFTTPKNCHFRNGELKTKILASLPGQTPTISQNLIYSPKYGTIYRLNKQKITAYYQTNKQLKEIDHIIWTNNQCFKTFMMTHDEEYLFIFSCEKIVKIQIKTALTKYSVEMELKDMFGGSKVINAGGIFVWLSLFQGVRMFGLTPDNKLQDLGMLTSGLYNDVAYNKGRLFLLSRHRYVQIYENQNGHKFKQTYKISLSNISDTAENRQLQLWNDNIYIYSINQGRQFISELYLHQEQLYLIRFFKGFIDVRDFEIYENYLLISTDHSLILLEINQDPRTITRIFNGISNNHFDRLQKLIRIDDKKFVTVTAKQINLIELNIGKSGFQCYFQKQGTQKIEYKGLCKPQQVKNPQLFYHYCSKDINLTIIIQNASSKLHLLAVVAVFLFCGAVMLYMVAWRQGKVQMIERLVAQINRIGNKNIQQIQFVQQHISRENQWDDIKQDYQAKEEQKDQAHDDRQDNQENHKKQDEVISTERQMITK